MIKNNHVLYKLLPQEREKIYEDVNSILLFHKSRLRDLSEVM